MIADYGSDNSVPDFSSIWSGSSASTVAKALNCCQKTISNMELIPSSGMTARRTTIPGGLE